MIAYSIIILAAFLGAILIPIVVAEEMHEQDKQSNQKLTDTGTDAFFMRR